MELSPYLKLVGTHFAGLAGRQVCTQQQMVLIMCDSTAVFGGKGSGGARDFEYSFCSLLVYFSLNLPQPTANP